MFIPASGPANSSPSRQMHRNPCSRSRQVAKSDFTAICTAMSWSWSEPNEVTSEDHRGPGALI